MNIIKYDKTRDADGKLIINGSSNQQTVINEGVSSRSEGSASLDRYIWGKYDDGGDIDGHMYVNGDIHIKTIIPPSYEPDEDDAEYDFEDDGDDVEQDEGGGNLYVDGKVTAQYGEFMVVKSTNIEATSNITAGSNITANGNISGVNINASSNVNTSTLNATRVNGDDIYLNYPESDSSKQNLRLLLEDMEERIAAGGGKSYDDRFDTIDSKLNSMGNKQDTIVNILGEMETRLTRMETKLNELKNCNCSCDGGGSGSGTVSKETIYKLAANGHPYVDMGPAGVWAAEPIVYGVDGHYFAWGETTGYNADDKDFSRINYKFTPGDITTPNKYNPTDGLTILEPEDDPVTVLMGPCWKTPTINEVYTLWEHTTQTHQGAGTVAISSKSDRLQTIFLTQSGYVSGHDFRSDRVCLWSSTVDTNYDNNHIYAYCISIDPNNPDTQYTSFYPRWYGMRVLGKLDVDENTTLDDIINKINNNKRA